MVYHHPVVSRSRVGILEEGGGEGGRERKEKSLILIQ